MLSALGYGVDDDDIDEDDEEEEDENEGGAQKTYIPHFVIEDPFEIDYDVKGSRVIAKFL